MISVILALLPLLIKAIKEGIGAFEMTPQDRAELIAYLDDVEVKLDAAAAKVAEYTPIPPPVA